MLDAVVAVVAVVTGGAADEADADADALGAGGGSSAKASDDNGGIAIASTATANLDRRMGAACPTRAGRARRDLVKRAVPNPAAAT